MTSLFPSVDKFLSGLSVNQYFSFQTSSVSADFSPKRKQGRKYISIEPPSRRAALSLPPHYRLLTKWNTKTCPCLTDNIPQLSEMRETGHAIESDVPYVTPLFIQIEEQQQRPPTSAAPNQSVLDPQFLDQKLKEAHERIRQQHNLLMNIRKVQHIYMFIHKYSYSHIPSQTEGFRPARRLPKRERAIPYISPLERLKSWITWPRWLYNVKVLMIVSIDAIYWWMLYFGRKKWNTISPGMRDG